ncbi:UDP-N-acetylmuramate:L-alanyl-gamma-D-glutamyl-meso-diaminopimelate ligase [Motilimonas cestriensis]|uniref:UDP-N-acetylmuramate--L-alanyl-gamma-D-glutamyl-meso-2,6-diaminoheptandioate ligase n=1 Tax=Motilimonas cestriensis TaxID=2742685 RepID=A0ABS8WBV7_9GAMM|nr:UDP-N-acetylmuramate:L-alanyl-gamma-D-glutamyl-meso-diaminopimelate ligase [Motilimonas cestriensis]MCE2596504.1 UDP-N-acetylmuramate:L-alanyl-gamma-D-glutamyl-meso-diaminopimelate ligase [Motilimonas cestriensis]
MHIHILGICGTFMGGLAILAKQLGHRVTGSDANVYPPMSTQLEEQGIELIQGYDPSQLAPAPDLIVVGNAMSRGNPCVEAMLNLNLPYISGPQWLNEFVLKDKWVLAASGTHGKTSTSSMLAWVLEFAGMAPGFLIGGVPENFGISARLGETPFFVIEADEYDSAFFDKRSKFVHYKPRTLIINNLEFDHADIFADLAAIQRQFHHLVRLVPQQGQIIYPTQTPAIDQVLEQGCWSELQTLNGDWSAEKVIADGTVFDVFYQQQLQGRVSWSLLGDHNIANALATIAAAKHVGVLPEHSIAALGEFKNAKRRMELKGEVAGIKVYDDFAHHPTAIKTTLAGLRAKVGKGRILAVLEPRSNTMKMGTHQHELVTSLQTADMIYCLQPEGLNWSLPACFSNSDTPAIIESDLSALLEHILLQVKSGDSVLIMSNGGFGGIHQRLIERLAQREEL